MSLSVFALERSYRRSPWTIAAAGVRPGLVRADSDRPGCSQLSANVIHYFWQNVTQQNRPIFYAISCEFSAFNVTHNVTLFLLDKTCLFSLIITLKSHS